MGQQQSKGELLFQQINYHNIEGIKALHRDGANLECVDREGRTPLILACMKPELYAVAKTLIELGANVNAYRPGRLCGTPLHHATKRGLAPTVDLLLSHGANALLVNDDCQTPLEIARAKGFADVVRTIEGHICLFAGWLRELYGPSILERFAPQLLSRKVWVVVVPCGSRSLRTPYKLELVIYATMQDAQPRMTIALWKANMEDPVLSQADYTVVVSEPSNKTRIKLAPLNERDKQQLRQFCDACKGIPQVAHTAFPFNAPTTFSPVTPSSSTEDAELAMAISASLQSSTQEGIPAVHAESLYGPATSASAGANPKDHASSSSTKEVITPLSAPSAPSAPPLDPVDETVHYPSIDLDPEGEKKGSDSSSSCVVCLDAPVEGACVPCGHMAGCLSCLKEIQEKNWGCPICRAKIDQVIRVYAV